MNTSMWKKALTVIPNVTKEEWDKLDLISKWLISTRAAVLLMTFLSAVLAGLLAWHDGYKINPFAWFILALGLVLAHASNNIFNDFTDYTRGVDKDNYYRTMYGPQPIADGLMTRRQHLTYFAVTAFLALLCGLFLVFFRRNDLIVWILLALGAFFVLFYTWPLKYIALGEVAVFIVWGPLMIGGGYYVLTGVWNWTVTLATVPYVLGVTTVIFGKHIDKLREDAAKKIHTLPVIIGEKASRYTVMVMMALQYLLVVALVVSGDFTPAMLLVLLALIPSPWVWKMLTQPKPASRPEEDRTGWPMWFVSAIFVHNRRYGMLFLLGLIADAVIKRLFL